MIGCGLISHAHGRAARKSDGAVQFVACASRNAETARAWAREYGCRVAYTDYGDMLRQEKLDGVVIATWPADHRAHIEAVLGAGVRYVLCEKALTLTGIDSMAIWQAADRHDATVVEGFMYRHHPAMAEIGRVLAGNELGVIDNIRGVFHMLEPGVRADGTRSWRQRREAGGGVAYDFTCYPVDAVNALARALPLRAFATGSISEATGVLDRLFGHIQYENGLIGSVETSHRAAFSQALEINGTQGRLTMPVAWSIRDEAIIRRTRITGFLEYEEEERRVPQPETHDGRLVDLPVFKLQLENFAGVIRGEETPAISLAESVVNAFVVDALMESFDRKRPIEISIPAPVRESVAHSLQDGELSRPG